MGTADGEGQERDDSLVHKSFEVNAYLVKANLPSIDVNENEMVRASSGARLRWRRDTKTQNRSTVPLHNTADTGGGRDWHGQYKGGKMRIPGGEKRGQHGRTRQEREDVSPGNPIDR